MHMPAPESEGTTGVMAQVLTLLTGAAADNGFQGIQGRFRRKGWLGFARTAERGRRSVCKRVRAPGAAVAVELDVSLVPGDPAQGGRLMAILQDRADSSQRKAFADAWQARVPPAVARIR